MSESSLEGTLMQARHCMSASHSLDECTSTRDFSIKFHAVTGCLERDLAHQIIDSSADCALFLVGALPLGTAIDTSPIELMVLVDSSSVIFDECDRRDVELMQHEILADEATGLLDKSYVTHRNGIVVTMTVVITPKAVQIYKALRKRGPELGEAEIATLGLLSSGWLLWQSDGYLERRGLQPSDPVLHIYCSTKYFSYALIWRRKAAKVLEIADIPLALHLGRSSVEMAYLAFFASEGLSYLGPNWLAQLGYARDARDRVRCNPLLGSGISLLFPVCGEKATEVERYLAEVSKFVADVRELIGRRTLFRIAFDACPQIFTS